MRDVKEWEGMMDELIGSYPHKEAKLLKKGVEFAKKAHAGAIRKSTGQPYIVHPYEVCLVASTVTRDVEVLIAALLHDVVEDTDFEAEDIRKHFGDKVTEYVLDESEDKMEGVPKAMSWMIRKEKFIEHLKAAPVESKTVCVADKVSNLRSMVEEYKKKGDEFWNIFNQKDPQRHAWYYRTIGETVRDDFINTEAFREYNELYQIMFGGSLIKAKVSNGGLSMEINELKSENNIVWVEISGRITSSNAEDLFVGANDIIKAHPGCEMVYDLEGLEMISSAGLRVFLRLKKAGVSFKLINAVPEVYQVFEITGFVHMFDIKKAYRKMSVDDYTVIGEGAKGIVYKIDDEMIIKVYKDPDCMNDIVNERECARKALVMGVPTAIPFDIVKVGDKFGSVFELVAANSVTKAYIGQPDNRENIINEYARVMHDMHDVKDEGDFGIALPKMKTEVVEWAEFLKDYVDETSYEKLKKFADDMSDEDTLLHGDGHPNNVMLTSTGPLFIDMDTLCTGDERADLAIVYGALVGFKKVDPDNSFIEMNAEASEKMWKLFIKAYCPDKSDAEITELERWCRIFVYMRLYRRGLRKEKNKPLFAENARTELLKAINETA